MRAISKLNNAFSKIKFTPENLFRRFDYNQNGFLSKDEFTAAISYLDSKSGLTPEEKDLIVEASDINNNEELDYNAFVNFLDLA